MFVLSMKADSALMCTYLGYLRSNLAEHQAQRERAWHVWDRVQPHTDAPCSNRHRVRLAEWDAIQPDDPELGAQCRAVRKQHELVPDVDQRF